jgi:protein-L-isoaspartate(D-aspartate) O-methyltransferase
MINRCLFTPNGDNPPFPVPLDDLCTVPTEEMANLLANLVLGGDDDPGLTVVSFKDILEIGTGSGFQAAVLAERCRSVFSVDVEMRSSAIATLPSNVFLMTANGYEFDSGEEFDGVLVTFGASRISENWVKQTKVGGLLVVPLDTGTGCRISVYGRTETGLRLLDVVAYAPFTPGAEA